MTVDPNFIMNGLSLAILLWVAGSVSGLRERVARIEERLAIRPTRSEKHEQA